MTSRNLVYRTFRVISSVMTKACMSHASSVRRASKGIATNGKMRFPSLVSERGERVVWRKIPSSRSDHAAMLSVVAPASSHLDDIVQCVMIAMTSMRSAPSQPGICLPGNHCRHRRAGVSKLRLVIEAGIHSDPSRPHAMIV
jgi:hypothetical protein